MPGKVNPVIPEAVNQTAFQVIGNDLATTMAAEAGQLQLNAMEPLIVYNILNSLRMLTNACNMLTERCIRGITANREHCEATVRDSIGIVTAFSPSIGYEKATELAQKALLSGGSVVDLIREEGVLDAASIEYIMRPENLTGPMRPENGPTPPITEEKKTSPKHFRKPTLTEIDRSYTHLFTSVSNLALDGGSFEDK